MGINYTERYLNLPFFKRKLFARYKVGIKICYRADIMYRGKYAIARVVDLTMVCGDDYITKLTGARYNQTSGQYGQFGTCQWP
jgi:hypothetical protein